LGKAQNATLAAVALKLAPLGQMTFCCVVFLPNAVKILALSLFHIFLKKHQREKKVLCNNFFKQFLIKDTNENFILHCGISRNPTIERMWQRQ
jgi:hypothetical protein